MTRSFSYAEFSLDSNYSNRWRQWNRDERKRVQASRKYELPRGLVDMQNDRILPLQYESLNFPDASRLRAAFDQAPNTGPIGR